MNFWIDAHRNAAPQVCHHDCSFLRNLMAGQSIFLNFPWFSSIFITLNNNNDIYNNYNNIISNNIEQFILYFRTLQGFRMKENTFKISKSIIVLFACTEGGGRHTTSIIHHLYQASEKDKSENWRKLHMSRKLLLYP